MRSALGYTFLVAGNLGRVRSRRQRGRTSWFVDLRPAGRIYSIPDPAGAGVLPIPSRAVASRILENVRQAVMDGKSLEQAVAPWLSRTAPELRVGARWALFCDQVERKVAAGERSAGYLRELRRYGKPGGYLEPIRWLPVSSVQYGHLEDLDAELARRGLSPKTRSHVQRSLRTFFRWLQRRGDVEAVPQSPVVTVPEHLPNLLDPAAQRAVLDAIPEPERGIFLALAFHGLRPTEATWLDVADWCSTSRVVTARRTKVRRSRRIPASAELAAWIWAHVDLAGRLTGAPLFANPRGRGAGKRWTLDALEDAWARASRAVGVRSSLYEGTKHTSATAARRAGVALEVIQAALGHADVRSTERYARAAELAPTHVLDVSRVSLAGGGGGKDERNR